MAFVFPSSFLLCPTFAKFTSVKRDEMTIAAAKEKLHDYIDHADDKKVMEMLSLLEGEGKSDYKYDEATLNILRERSEEYLTGKSTTRTAEESMEHIRQHRKKNGI
jgi:hypothetical protein